MTKRVNLACQQQIENIKIEYILPLRKIAPGTRTTVKYRRIAASIREIGIIEPPVVHPHNEVEGQYMLLDGHILFVAPGGMRDWPGTLTHAPEGENSRP